MKTAWKRSTMGSFLIVFLKIITICHVHTKFSPKIMQKNQIIDKNIHIESRQNILTKNYLKYVKFHYEML